MSKQKYAYLSTDDELTDEKISDDILDSVSLHIRQTYVNLDGEIDGPENYRKVFSILQKASRNDAIVFRINSFGGDVGTAIQIVNGIQNSDAFCVAEIYSAYSAAGVIALACDKIVPMQFSSMMIHNISWGSGGKVNEIKAHSDFMKTWSEQIVMKAYNTFLSKKEIKSILAGSDLWLTENEITERLEKWKPMRKFTEEA
jgi:ATP-dependent protease ClpP protease subunit